MDPIAHTLAGAALAASGLRKTTPLATAALMIGANIPDVDVLVSFGGEFAALAHRRGWTHGILAWFVLPLVLTSLLIAWDRRVRRRADAERTPADPRVLLMLSALAVLTHPALDWLNNYGIRLLMPFDGRWFYGDALFVIDPWVWLILGGACFLAWSRSTSSLVSWLLLWATASLLIVSVDYVTTAARYAWFAGLATLLGVRFLNLPGSVERSARLALSLAAFYMVATIFGSRLASEQVEDILTADGSHEIRDVMVGPWPANPFAGNVVIATEDRYLLGQWDWLAPSRLTLVDEAIHHNMKDPAVQAAARAKSADQFLTWSRFPYAKLSSTAQGYEVLFGDARYARMNSLIRGPTVVLSSTLQIADSKEDRDHSDQELLSALD